ncbi:NAD(P)H-dependent glycerol-3-phosphate dehydrogenase [Syntrophobacter fumaroxidans]|uniref:Glycerol-3-phosphate dehydrogenase [NAD(P)+] n=1 Tax=Syntrophobacter fumaroxidans (strain DSM 10017 / MPOB) TaxID=335543 RepID=GPDA_SYNFM|nr:NAD(P)H-dependent glycerol-3-phosphate dehydrogenase [Syntrophobacter fumaroxidans]A0LLR7.1 RecName: Full=Glycerol-3-phosphate dehydrogenase [NAD(P)+]; AltName: Full=NAD(P)H-dependent glycerol-3-phosphate dehydrogenase [Syntrophobacter fumaroxidans MPOB]ABK18369.1 Glycerol-3-phosphate dehydrogenase (NAD(P)(+)) [Syntrophobacter fumaroxidans MPOB]
MKPGGPIGVVGAGSWGTTLAQVIADKGFEVDLWVFEPELCKTIRETRQNDLYLPGVVLSGRINAHNDLDRVVKNHDLLIMVVPSHVYRNVATAMIPFLKPDAVVVNATKGIENDTLLTMSGIWREVLPPGLQVRVLCLSGPSFAREVARKVPTAVTLAGDELQTAKAVQHVISTGYFRIYTSLDKIGVEIAGASKNVIALAAGVSDGMSFGYNSRAALITRGLAEITRLGVKMGSNPLTFLGLAGIGDLLLTCTGDLSRNRTVGIQLGQGRRIKDILAEMRMVAEGVKTAKSIHFLARRIGVEMPICEQVYRVIYEDKDPRVVVRELMERDLKHELELGH